MAASRLGFWGALTVVLLGCGPEGQVIATASTQTGGYAGQCQVWAGRHRQAVRDKKLEEPLLVVERWPGVSTATVAPAQFLKALAAGGRSPEVRRAALFARSGLGKSTFAESVRAELCGQLPVYVLDAKALASAPGYDNPLITQMKRHPGGLDPKLQATDARVLVIVDGLDEVDLSARGRVTVGMAEVQQKWPNAQLMLVARPPIVDAEYGVAELDVKVSLRPLTCEHAERVIRNRVKDEGEREIFQRFLTRHGLDVREEQAGGCTFEYMASYGDIEKLLAFYREATVPTSDILMSRSNSHEALIAERLHKELHELGWTGAKTLQLTDAMVAAQMRRGPTRELRFDMAACLAVIEAGGSPTRQERACEKLLQSPLFDANVGGGHVLSGPGLVDLFVARWLNAETRDGQECGAALKQPSLLHSGEVLRFLLGQPGGIRCAAPLMDDRCGLDPRSDVLSQLDDGLPAGRARAPIWAAIQAQYESTHWKMCTQKSIKGLKDTF
jgi:hypothetical protein